MKTCNSWGEIVEEIHKSVYDETFKVLKEVCDNLELNYKVTTSIGHLVTYDLPCIYISSNTCDFKMVWSPTLPLVETQYIETYQHVKHELIGEFMKQKLYR